MDTAQLELPYPPTLHVVRDITAPADKASWHLRWQCEVPIKWTEVALGNHRADILTPDGTIVELQDSPLPRTQIAEREDHYCQYGNMVWVFNVTAEAMDGRFTHETRPEPDLVRYRWPRQRQDILACTAPVYLDTGRGCLLRVRSPRLAPPWTGCGTWVDTDLFVDWLNGRHLAEAA